MILPEVILEERVIPVARGLNGSSAPMLVEALQAGGVNSIEITVESPGGLEAIAAVAATSVAIGAGTVSSIMQATEAIAAGAHFLVTPHLDADLLAWAEESGVSLIPGAMTPTEIFTAWRHRPPAVKVFPAHVGGPAYLKSLLGPYPDLKLVPTGGVTDENIGRFIAAGAVAVGVGGWLTGINDYDEVTRRAAMLVRAASSG